MENGRIVALISYQVGQDDQATVAWKKWRRCYHHCLRSFDLWPLGDGITVRPVITKIDFSFYYS